MIAGFARFAAQTFFREIVIEGRENLPATGTVLFTPNHPNGLLDPMLMFFLSPEYDLRFVAKAQLFKIPIFGWILRSLGAIPVVRKFETDGAVDYSPFFARCVDALSEGGSIVIFPEGRSLPQAYLAPLKTGPARIFLLARERGVHVSIVPVGLNYEQGTTFRSRVLVSVGPSLNETSLSARDLTAKLNSLLQQHVVQAQSYQERELMILLERISSERSDDDFAEGFSRLKNFEQALVVLRDKASKEIETLRILLQRYSRLWRQYRAVEDSMQTNRLWVLLCAVIALPGWLFNFLPYHICDRLIRLTRKDASDAATFKVIYSLFLFPGFYILEGFVLHHYWGGPAALCFAVLILPASYFTLYCMDWYEQRGAIFIKPHKKATLQLKRLRERILIVLNSLAAKART
jgi:glycerol-3-phosphate O-acyltransferase / dihydroxyacetone phosphate acyltransferase